jgi:hypothetical protein
MTRTIERWINQLLRLPPMANAFFTVYGTIYRANGAAWPGAMVSFAPKEGQPYESYDTSLSGLVTAEPVRVKANTQGYFQTNLVPGVYTIIFPDGRQAENVTVGFKEDPTDYAWDLYNLLASNGITSI